MTEDLLAEEAEWETSAISFTQIFLCDVNADDTGSGSCLTLEQINDLRGSEHTEF